MGYSINTGETERAQQAHKQGSSPGFWVRKCFLMIAASNLWLINMMEGLMLLGHLAWSVERYCFLKRGIHSGENILGERTNFVLNVEFEVLMGYPSGAVLGSFGSGCWEIGLD